MDFDTKVVRITNIANFDFTPEMGARYGGRDFPLRAGESRMYPFTLGDHLATHLARQIILKAAPGRTDAEVDGKGTTNALWSDTRIAELKAQILKHEYEESAPAQKSEADMLAERVEQLNCDPEIAAMLPQEEANLTSTDGSLDAGAVGLPSGTSQTIDASAHKTKADIINELQAKGVTFNPRSSKSELQALLEQ